METFVIYDATKLAPLVGLCPSPKHPTSRTYGKWVALKYGNVWYIQLGGMMDMHDYLSATLSKLHGSSNEEKRGTIHQRGGHGTAIEIRTHDAPPQELKDSIVKALLEAQRKQGLAP